MHRVTKSGYHKSGIVIRFILSVHIVPLLMGYIPFLDERAFWIKYTFSWETDARLHEMQLPFFSDHFLIHWSIMTDEIVKKALI